jgi:hypothetical protein
MKYKNGKIKYSKKEMNEIISRYKHIIKSL